MKYYSILRCLIILIALVMFSGFSSAYTIKYYHQDYLGNNAAITDEDGEVIWKSDYEPFGNPLNENGEINSLKYNNKEQDDTGLYYYGARYYDSELGRFMTADTISGSLADPQSMNRYAYVKNNPMKYVDPSGNEPKISDEGWQMLSSLSDLAGSDTTLTKDNKFTFNINPEKISDNGVYHTEIPNYKIGGLGKFASNILVGVINVAGIGKIESSPSFTFELIEKDKAKGVTIYALSSGSLSIEIPGTLKNIASKIGLGDRIPNNVQFIALINDENSVYGYGLLDYNKESGTFTIGFFDLKENKIFTNYNKEIPKGIEDKSYHVDRLCESHICEKQKEKIE